MQDQNITNLAVASRRMLDRYLELAGSGDCGNWNPEEEEQVVALREALGPYEHLYTTPAQEHIGMTFYFSDDDTRKLWRVVQIEGSSGLYYVAADCPTTIKKLRNYITLAEEIHVPDR